MCFHADLRDLAQVLRTHVLGGFMLDTDLGLKGLLPWDMVFLLLVQNKFEKPRANGKTNTTITSQFWIQVFRHLGPKVFLLIGAPHRLQGLQGKRKPELNTGSDQPLVTRYVVTSFVESPPLMYLKQASVGCNAPACDVEASQARPNLASASSHQNHIATFLMHGIMYKTLQNPS